MEILATIGLVGNIIQFVDFSAKLISKSAQLYQSSKGALEENIDIETATNRLILLNNKIKDSATTAGDQSLESLCKSCSTVTIELLAALDKVKVRGKQQKRESISKALQTIYGKEKINKLERQLAEFRQELNLHLTVDLRVQVRRLMQERSDVPDLDSTTKEIIHAIAKQEEIFRTTHDRQIISMEAIQDELVNFRHEIIREIERHKRDIYIGKQEREVFSLGNVDFSIPPQLEFSRNTNFVGRDEILQRIHESIMSQRRQASDPIKLSIIGMGGIGKTQIIQEYAYKHQREFSSVFWVKANSYDSAVNSYFTIAQALVNHAGPSVQKTGLVGILDKTNLDYLSEAFARRVVQAVKYWLTLEGNNKWLLLFDNWDNLQDERMESLIPNGGSGVVLITSRRQDWARNGCSLEIAEMEEAASLKLLSRNSLSKYGESNQDDHNAAKEVVQALGYLPLAVDQAGAYIHKLKISVRTYLCRLNKNAKVLSQKPPAQMWPYHETVLSTWEISLKEIEGENAEALEILQICAFLTGEDMNEQLLRYGFEFARMDSLALALEDAMGTLFAFSLAKRQGADDGFSTHTMIQTCVRERLGQSDKQKFAEKAVLVVAGAISKIALDSRSNWITSRQLLSHVASCEKYLKSPLQNNEAFYSTRALFILGQFCSRFSQHDRAIAWFKKDLDGVQHLSLLASLEDRFGIATAMLFKGQLYEALAQFECLYAEASKNIGVKRALTCNIANSLGLACKKLGRYEKALGWYQVSLAEVVGIFGEADQRTLATLNNIGVLQKELKKYPDACKTLESVLRQKEAVLGEEDPSTLETVMNVGVVYGHSQRYDEALCFLQRALSGKEKYWGKDSPNTIDVKGNIANVYLKQGRLEKAIELYKATLDGHKKAYSHSMHQSIFITTSCLGDAYYRQGCYKESLKWYYEALSGREQILGKGSVQALETICSIANVFLKQGRFWEAIHWYKRALDGFRNACGTEDFRVRSVEKEVRALLLHLYGLSS
ncbi:uncharacterized protein PAC_12460 [Phialocephala subalpina]|uniref:NB-ARC domain-containing protein n=1 Tax=Phialocephala subalpina TaxID=576137 RepID=A0A1L7XC12_9HELO|nr:uncharacterized protein PAC_12460 [Phialocephala subalpina]